MGLFSHLVHKRYEPGGRGPDAYGCTGIWEEVNRILGKSVPCFQDIVLVCADENQKHEAVEKRRSLFRRIDRPERPELGDLVLVQDPPGKNSHVGVIVDHGIFLHACEELGVHRSRLDNPLWRNRIEGIYRYVGSN